MGSVNHSALTGTNLHTPFVRTYAGDPTGAATPNFTNELLWDSTNARLYVAEGATSADWVAMVNAARELHPLISGVGAPTTHTTSTATNAAWQSVGGGKNSGTSYTLAGYVTETTSRTGNAQFVSAMRYDSTVAATSTDSPAIDFYVAIPPEFTGWDEAGIRVLHKVTWTSGSDEAASVSLEAFDPASNAAWGTPKIHTRTIAAGTSDTTYSFLQVDGTALGADYTAGDFLRFRVTLRKTSVNGGTPNTIRLSVAQIQLHWNDL